MKKRVGRIAAVAIAVMMIAALSVTAFAGTFSRKDAEKKALKDAGLTKTQVTALQTESDKTCWEVEFKKKSNRTEYEYDIRKSDGKIVSKSIDYVYKPNHSKAKIGKAAAYQKVADYSGFSLKVVKSGTCRYEYDTEDREGTYTVKFTKGEYRFEYELLAPTGKIIEVDKKLKK